MRERLGASEAAVDRVDDDIDSSSDFSSKVSGNKQKGIATLLALLELDLSFYIEINVEKSN